MTFTSSTLITVCVVLSLGIASITACPGADLSDGSKLGDPFASKEKSTIEELKRNPFFEGFEYDIFVAKPFVILMTHEPGEDSAKIDERKIRSEKLARGIWRNWLKIRADWQLTSTRKDTLESPDPFVWTAFHSEDAYNRYMKKATSNAEYTPGGLAYYSTKTRHVSFYEDPQLQTDIITIHETFHQLMDRFSVVPSTQYQNYFFTEGTPEYFAGYRGEGDDMVLGELTRTKRMKQIQKMRLHFNQGKNLCYPNHERKWQITPDDWVFYDVPMLLTLRDQAWVRGIVGALMVQFKRSDYMKDAFCKSFVEDGDVDFHYAFYAYAWAFTYWLNKNYPDAYRRYAMAVLNTKDGGDAEVFLEAFGITPVRPLPDIRVLVGPNNRDVVKNQKEAVACLDKRIAILRQTPEIQLMHRQWVEWMTTTFAKP
jgi:hypothetical protein